MKLSALWDVLERMETSHLASSPFYSLQIAFNAPCMEEDPEPSCLAHLGTVEVVVQNRSLWSSMALLLQRLNAAFRDDPGIDEHLGLTHHRIERRLHRRCSDAANMNGHKDT